jgi:hypothetical protein
MAELSEAFWIAFIATVSAMFGLSLRMCLRSRCDRVDCLCLKIHRDTQLEHDEAQNNPDTSTRDLELGEIYNRSEKITI